MISKTITFLLYYISLVTFNYVPFENHFISTVWVENTNITLESVQVFYRLIIYLLPMKIQLSKGKSWNPTMWFNPATFLPLSQARTWISSITCGGLFYDQWAEVKGDCSFCWYWRNYWPSLFKHTFHKQLSSKCKKKP